MYQNYKRYRKLSSAKATIILLIFAALAILITWGIWSLWDFVAEPIIHEESFDRIIEDAGRRNNVDPALIRAVIWRESKFNRHTVGNAGEIGLMQIRPDAAVADWANHKKRPRPLRGALADPALNVEIGSWYLGRALKYWVGYKDQIALALCEYNAGRVNAKRWKPRRKDERMTGNITFPTTREYVGDILRKYEEYRQAAAQKREAAASRKKKK